MVSYEALDTTSMDSLKSNTKFYDKLNQQEDVFYFSMQYGV